ncbi:MAG: hypothetical protein AAF560_27250 [Acidobacteriota bacterium]
MRSKSFACLAIAALFLALPAAGQDLNEDHNGALGIPDDFAPPGELFDNDVANGTTSLASQDSAGTFFARSADEFSIDNSLFDCETGLYEITGVRAQVTQAPAAPQPFGFEFYAGDASAPMPADAAVPVAGPLAEASRVDLGPFGTIQLFEVGFPGGGTVLEGDTIYWTSAFGTDAAANAGGFNNFYAASDGAAGSVANSVIIAPDAGVPTWTPVDTVIGPPALHFSFAIDGFCIVEETPTIAIPTLNSWGLLLLVGMLAAASMFFMARTRRV